MEKVSRASRRQRHFGEISHDLWGLTTTVLGVELEGAAKQLLRAPGNRCVLVLGSLTSFGWSSPA